MEDSHRHRPEEVSALRRVFQAPEWGLVAGICAVLVLIYYLDPSHAFFMEYSRQTLLHQVALFGILSVGAAVVIISGGIDLSIGAVVALSSIVSAKLVTDWLRSGPTAAMPPSSGVIALAIALTLLMGLGIGFLHAFLINQLRLPPFIATLATMAGLRSLAAILSKNQSINVPYEAFRIWGRDPLWTEAIFLAGRRVGELDDGDHGAGPPPLRVGGQRGGRPAQRAGDPPPEGGGLRPLGDARSPGGHPLHRAQRPGRQPARLHV